MSMDKHASSRQSPGESDSVTKNSWRKLNTFTDARIGLGRAGVSLPSRHLLAFQLAHAQAIDAVHSELDLSGLSDQLIAQSWSPEGAPIRLHSRAENRAEYLQRPDYGRRLDEASAAKLDMHRASQKDGYDLVIAIVDGLSSRAIEENTLPFLTELLSELQISGGEPHEISSTGWTLAPLCLVEQGRVAIGDDICERLNARCVLVLVGERPGLSSPDSLGLYLTWGAKVGLTDAYRNCISNVRPAGLSYREAARKAAYLLREAKRLKLSGVKLKDRSSDERVLDSGTELKNFLVS